MLMLTNFIKRALGTQRGDGYAWCAITPNGCAYVIVPGPGPGPKFTCHANVRACALRSNVVCKPLVSGQTFGRMLGYVWKDVGQAHFKNESWGVEQAEIDRGIEDLAALKLDFMEVVSQVRYGKVAGRGEFTFGYT